MKSKAIRNGTIGLALLAAAAGAAFAQGPGQGPGYGPGGGWGPGMMGGGHGGGPGMMGGGYGGGSGMMGGYYGGGPGYGPGTMHGYGGGPGYGPGMMGRGYGPGALNLTDEQRDKIAAIQEDVRAKNWDTMGKMRSEQFKLRRMYNADNLDAKAIGEQQKKVDDLRRQMLTSQLETRKHIDAVLTPEQRKQSRQFGPWWLREESE